MYSRIHLVCPSSFLARFIFQIKCYEEEIQCKKRPSQASIIWKVLSNLFSQNKKNSKSYPESNCIFGKLQFLPSFISSFVSFPCRIRCTHTFYSSSIELYTLATLLEFLALPVCMKNCVQAFLLNP